MQAAVLSGKSLSDKNSHTSPEEKARVNKGVQKSDAQSKVAIQIATPIIFSNYQQPIQNHCIHLSDKLKGLFPYLKTKVQRRYAQVGARVYQIAFDSQLENGLVGLNALQYADVEAQKLFFSFRGENCVTLNPFILGDKQPSRVDKLKLNIFLNRDLNLPGQNSKNLNLESMQAVVLHNLQGHFVGYHQSFFMSFPEGHFQVSVKGMKFRKGSDKSATSSPFGYVDKDTQFKFNNENPQDLQIVVKRNNKLDAKLKFSITLKQKKQQIGVFTPSLIQMDGLKQELLKTMENQQLTLGDTFYFKDHKGIRLKLLEILTPEELFTRTKSNSQSKNDSYVESYACLHLDQIEFMLQKSIVLGRGNPILATQVVVEVFEFKRFNDTSVRGLSKLGYVDAESIARVFKRASDPFTKKQEFSLQIPQGIIRCRLKKVCGTPKDDQMVSKHTLWTVDENTVYDVEMGMAIHLAIVDETKPSPLKKVKIEVAYSGDSQFKIEFLKLIQGLYSTMTQNVVLNQTLNLQLKGFSKIQLKLIEFELSDTEIAPIRYGKLGKIEEDTILEFVPKTQSIQILKDGQDSSQISPIKELENLGVGGLTKEVAETVNRLILFRRNRAKLLPGTSMAKGIVLYGAPGTGKTRLAKAIPQLLGKDAKMVNATEVLNRYLGASEENIRELFNDPASDIIVFDEFDAIASKRFDGGNKAYDKIVNELLSCMSGLKPTDKLVIVTTNALDQFDPALLRSGRFDIKLEMIPPDFEGRKQIFKIYTKDIQKLKLLDPSIDFDELAVESDGLTGADIARIVSIAKEKTTERRLVNETEVEVVMASDFKHAFKQFKKDNKCEDHDREKVEAYFL